MVELLYPLLHFHAGDLLTEFFKLCCRKESTEEVLGRGLADEEGKGQVTDSVVIKQRTFTGVCQRLSLHKAKKDVVFHRHNESSMK